MAFDDSMFSFEMMNALPLDFSVGVPHDGNELGRCDKTTFLQLQEKVLRSMAQEWDDDNNLQVVPQSNCFLKEDPRTSFRESCALKCRENRTKNTLHSSTGANCTQDGEGENNADTLQSLPKVGKTPLFQVTVCTSPEPLRTPTFQFSPLLKSPARSVEAPVSPLATMILSPFGRKMSEDLSVYLPDNFTPVSTLERLENSITSTVFEFPSVEENLNAYKTAETFKRQEGRKVERAFISRSATIQRRGQVDIEIDDVFADLDEIDCFEVKKAANYERQFDSSERNRKRKRKEKLMENNDEILRFRNKLERRRRNEMNFKYDKLRQIIPAIEKGQKVAKIVVLRSAVEYIKELQRQDRLLTKQKNLEKRLNAELLKKLVKINS